MPPWGGGAAAEARDADDDDQHHLIERSEEGRMRREHLSNHDREAEALWQQQAKRFGEGSSLRRAIKALMTGTLLLLLLSLMYENLGKSNLSGDIDGRGVAFTQVQRDAGAAATAAALAGAAAKENELKKQLDVEIAKRHEAEDEAFAAKEDLQVLKKAVADVEAAAVAAEVKKMDEEEAASVASAVAAAKMKKDKEQNKEAKATTMTVAVSEKEGEKPKVDVDEAAAVAVSKKEKVKATTWVAAVDQNKKKSPKTDEDEVAIVAAAVAAAENKKKEEEKYKNGTAAAALEEEEDGLEVEEEFAARKAEPTKKSAKGKVPAESSGPLRPTTSSSSNNNNNDNDSATTTNVPAVDLSTLDAAEKQTKLAAARTIVASSLLALERDHTPEHGQTLFDSLHFHNRTYVKHKLIRALLGQNGSPHKPESEHDFIMSFAGTSVTAGHDNFFSQSYPIVLQKILLKAYTAAGLNLEIRNHAMGNNPSIPAAFCVKSQLGGDTDVAAWEFGMMVEGPLQNAYVEEWMRNALYLPKRPALLMVDQGEGARKPNAKGVLPINPRVGLPSVWGFRGREGNLLEYYSGYGVHTQAMYEALWTLDHLPQYNFKALVQDNKPTPRPADWHPGPGEHLLRAQILGHHYLMLLEDAMVDVQVALEADSAAGVDIGTAATSQVRALLASTEPAAGAAAAAGAAVPPDRARANKIKNLPPPLYCDPLFCGSPASCAMTFEPKQQSSLLDLVLSPKGLWAATPTIDPQDNKKWHTQLFEADHDAAAFSQVQGFEYLDMKYVLQGNRDAGPLTLAVETQTKQRILFCQPPSVDYSMPNHCGNLWADAAFTIDDVPMGLEMDTNFYFQHTIESSTCWATKEMVEAGSHAIKIMPTNAKGKYIVLSALIWY